MTNADRIRNMTDEELAMFLSKTRCNLNMMNAYVVAYRAETVAENLKWLQKEVEE